jgi:hypothetical protein
VKDGVRSGLWGALRAHPLAGFLIKFFILRIVLVGSKNREEKMVGMAFKHMLRMV